MFNLIQNAIKAMPGGGHIGVHMSAGPAGYVSVKVSDTGPGIPEKILPKIFDPFFSTTRSTGLGLTKVKRNIELHQGTITVYSRKGGGTTFRISLPLLRAKARMHKGARRREAAWNQQKSLS